jgi:hypothetical protein
MNYCKINKYTKHTQFFWGVSHIAIGIIGLVFLFIAEIFWGY